MQGLPSRPVFPVFWLDCIPGLSTPSSPSAAEHTSPRAEVRGQFLRTPFHDRHDRSFLGLTFKPRAGLAISDAKWNGEGSRSTAQRESLCSDSIGAGERQPTISAVLEGLAIAEPDGVPPLEPKTREAEVLSYRGRIEYPEKDRAAKHGFAVGASFPAVATRRRDHHNPTR